MNSVQIVFCLPLTYQTLLIMEKLEGSIVSKRIWEEQDKDWPEYLR